jgi:hypothetical protein
MQMTSPVESVPNPELRERAQELFELSLTGVERLVEGGKGKAAAAALRTLLRRASPEQAAGILERGAVAELAREQGWEPPRRKDVWVPPSPVKTCQGEPVRLTREGLAQKRTQRRGDAAAAMYLTEQDPAPVGKSGWDEPVWGNIDYDLAALYDLHGAPCLGCLLERTRTDLANRDGLCVDCREGGLTRELVIQRCCALVADRNTAERTTELLRRAWKRADRPADQAVITEWVAQHQARPAA